VLGTGPSDAAFVVSAGTGTLHWCDESKTDILLVTTGFDEAAARALGATVQPVDGRPTDLTLRVPAGFVAGRPSTAGLGYNLAFGPKQTTATKPSLTVLIRSAWTTDLRLLKTRSVHSSATEVDVGGRRGFSGQLPGGPRFQALTVVFDDRTIVELAGDGLSAEQLLSAAASLGPADPSTAPDVSGDPQRCERLGMCG